MVRDDAGSLPGMDSMVCLEHGDTCTGSMCPIFDVPSAEMKAKLDAYRAEMEELEEESE